MGSNTTNIPIVDLTSPNAAKDLLDAAVAHGFMYIKHNNALALSRQDVNKMFALVTRYIQAQPMIRSSI